MADLIYANPLGKEIGIVPYAEGDFTVGVNNNFSLNVPPDIGLAQDYRIMIEGMEFGGVIDGIGVDTTQDYITISGRTWQGILESSIIRPNQGADYYTVSGDLNVIICTVIARLGLEWCMVAETKASGYTVSNYQFTRYVNGYEGLRSLCRSVDCKLLFSYDPELRKVVLSAVKRGHYIDDGVDGENVDFSINTTRPVNHLIGLGKGELKDRAVVDVYTDANGKLSATQKLFGAAHKADTYESTSDEADKLLENTRKKILELQDVLNTCKLENIDGAKYDIDDIVGGTSIKHNVSVTTTIAQKIATISNDQIVIETRTETEVS